MKPASLINTIWLALLQAQRPLVHAEIRAALPELSDGQRGPALNAAFRLGYIEREGEHRAYSYRVTPRCNVPPGIQVREVLEAVS